MAYYKKEKEEVRACVCCNESHLIFDRNKWLCKDCYNKRKQEKLNRKTSEMKNNDLTVVFEHIWATRPHYCFHCDRYLGREPKSIFFSHILSRGAHPSLRCDEENIVLACEECHHIYDFRDKSKLKKQIPQELIDKLLKKERDEFR